jgi:hypothetical protein
MPTSAPEPFPLWLVPLLPAFFVAVWLGVCAVTAYVSRWPALAAHFRSAPRPEGRLVKGQVRGMGWANENGVTHMILAAAGLYLYVNPLFRFGRPPLLLPWERVRFLRERRFLTRRFYEFDLAGVTTLTLTQAGYDAIKSLARGRAGDAAS